MLGKAVRAAGERAASGTALPGWLWALLWEEDRTWLDTSVGPAPRGAPHACNYPPGGATRRVALPYNFIDLVAN